MNPSYLLHWMSHRILVVDISGEGVNGLLVGEKKEPDAIPILRFGSWDSAAAYFRLMGADEELLEQTHSWLQRTSTATLTILRKY